MTTSRTGTTRWLHNAAAAKRAARAAGLDRCPICHVHLTWDAEPTTILTRGRPHRASQPSAAPTHKKTSESSADAATNAKATAENHGHRNKNTEKPESAGPQTQKRGRIEPEKPGDGGHTPHPRALVPPWV